VTTAEMLKQLVAEGHEFVYVEFSRTAGWRCRSHLYDPPCPEPGEAEELWARWREAVEDGTAYDADPERAIAKRLEYVRNLHAVPLAGRPRRAAPPSLVVEDGQTGRYVVGELAGEDHPHVVVDTLMPPVIVSAHATKDQAISTRDGLNGNAIARKTDGEGGQG